MLTALPPVSILLLPLVGKYRPYPDAPPPNFISDIFYLALATGHYGLQKTIQTFEDLSKEHDEVQRHLDNITADNTWMGVSLHRRICHPALTLETFRRLCRGGLKLPSNN